MTDDATDRRRDTRQLDGGVRTGVGPPRRRFAAAAWVAVMLVIGSWVAAEVPGSSGTVVPGSVDNEVHLHIVNSSREPLVGVQAEAVDVPPNIVNLRIEPGRIDRIEHDRSAELTVLFDVAAGAPAGSSELVRFIVHLEEGSLDHTIAELRLKIAPAPELSVCAIRGDAPEDFPAEDAIDYCDPEREPTEYDRVAVFFTPPHDVSDPVEEREPFMWRVLGPNGDPQSGGSGAFAPELESHHKPFAKEGSPGRFAVVLELWDRTDPPDPARARSGPGTYSVQAVAAQYDATGVFGQGDASLSIRHGEAVGDEEAVSAEWEDVQTFEIPSRRLHFQGFVMERVDDVWWPDRDDVWEGRLTVSQPQVSGTSVVVEGDAWWRPAVRNGYGRFPGEEIVKAKSRLTLEFPEQLNPGHEEMGKITARLEALERDDYFFTAAMHLVVPSTAIPPDRHLVAGGGPPPWSPGGAESPDVCTGETFSGLGWTNRFEADHGGVVIGDDPAFDSGNPYWIWPRVPLAPTFCLTREPSVIDVEVTLLSGEPGDLAGDPERSFAELIADDGTRWFIPVFLNLTDKARPNQQSISMKTYGYAVYGPVEGAYDGPHPTGGPQAGDGPGEDGEDDETAPGESAGDDASDTGSEDPGGGENVVGVAGGGGVPGDPGSLDPDVPDVSALIREWLGVAEPPENATYGAQLHYNEWGVKLGRAAGGIISGTPGRPDDVGASTSPEYVWSLRDRLDSVDHCTVGEYVMARLESSSIAHCAGRYPRTVAVPRLTGLSVGEALTEIGRLGLETRPSLLGPAPSRELANRVAEQRPPPAGRLVRGATVEISFYGEFEQPSIVMPDLVGQTRTLAQAWLEDLGLAPVIQAAGPAPVADREGKVAAQSQPPSARLGPAEAVVLFVYQAVAAGPTQIPVPAFTQAECDRRWPGTVLTRDAATGGESCLCPAGTAWSKVRKACLSLSGMPPPRVADCRHMPGTIRNPATGVCSCPVGVWDPGSGRCVDTAAADREREIEDRSRAASCEKLYSDIVMLRRNPSPAFREMAAAREREARAMGCDAGRIAEATGGGSAGGGGGETPPTPVTGPVETREEGEARVSSHHVTICIIDINDILDDHFDVLVNGSRIGSVANPEGGATCFPATLRSGPNALLLQLVATRGSGTYLKISINNDEYSANFGGSSNHAWSVVAP